MGSETMYTSKWSGGREGVGGDDQRSEHCVGNFIDELATQNRGKRRGTKHLIIGAAPECPAPFGFSFTKTKTDRKDHNEGQYTGKKNTKRR